MALDKFVVIDLETTGHSPENNDKIIEIGLVVIKGNEIVDKRNTLLNPDQAIPPFITNLTNITDEDVKDAAVFVDKAESIVQLFEDSYLIAHNVPFDMGFLNTELENSGMKPLQNPVIDTVELCRILYPKSPSYKLSQLATYLGIQHDHPHRALSDAYVTAKIFLKLKEKLFQLPYETLYHLLKLEKKFLSDLDLLLEEAMEQKSFAFHEEDEFVTYQGLAFKMDDFPSREKPELTTSFGDYLDDIYEEDGALATHLEHYEKRDGQREMSETIYDAFQMKRHALIEAETGTGKSLAYLLPALYEAVEKQKRVIISTYTTQLQGQLLDEEIPLLKEIVPFPIEATVLKGRSHYLSLERFLHELNHSEWDNYDITLTKAILLVWLTETVTGDIDEIQLPAGGYAFFNRISAETERNLDPTSPWFRYSYYTRAKRRAQRADLVITNHALLCTDMFHEYQFLPTYDKLIIDEAHHFEDTAARHYGMTIDNVSMQYTMNQIGRHEEQKHFGYIVGKYKSEFKQGLFDEWDRMYDDAKFQIDELFQLLFLYVENAQNNQSLNDIGRIQYRFHEEDFHSDELGHIIETANRLISRYRDLIDFLTDVDRTLDQIDDYNKYDKQELLQMMESLKSYVDRLEQYFNSKQDLNQVRWVEMETRGSNQAVFLFCEPTSVATLLKDELFSNKESVILTSATLTMKNSFRFIMQRLGLKDSEPITKQISSPFSLKDQVQLLIPNDFPDVRYGKGEDFVYATSEAILSLAEITDGRMLVLFTSYDMLRKSYQLLKEFMHEEKFVLIAQGITSGSRTRLKKNFQRFERAILLGTSSFWEGVDIPGDDLSSLVIVRLPFQPPNHPVFEAKAKEMEEQGKNAFMELSLPNAVIKFKQGFGRLIRSKTDRGIVFVCDSRIMKARYGKFFIDSIPEVPTYFDSTKSLFEKAKTWF